VLLDGQQVCACLVAAGQVQGRRVTTVEGLANGAELSRLQQTFLAHGAAQCGICTPGMLMAAADVLARHPHRPKRGCAMAWAVSMPLYRLPQDHRAVLT
jgi:aerobic-type carbon monoxide dehydrogenase small subunit (CoxS/CutS family)